MDPFNVLGDLTEAKSSPSQDLQNLMKSDRESLDDFEHVGRGNADFNQQFINFEKGQKEAEGNVKEGALKDSPTLAGKISPEQVESDLLGFNRPPATDEILTSKNFMQYDNAGGEHGEKGDRDLDDFLKGEIKRTPEPQYDSDQSQDDDSIVKAATPEPIKTQTPEPRAKTPEKAPTPEPPAKTPSPEPVFVQPIREPSPPRPVVTKRDPSPPPVVVREPSPPRPAPKVPQHQAEDVAPPTPVPRDYPEIGVIEPRDILTAFGLCKFFYWFFYGHALVITGPPRGRTW